MSNYSKIKDIILKLNSEELLKEKLYIVGGTVPYLISNTMSNREHSDIDIIVAIIYCWWYSSIFSFQYYIRQRTFRHRHNSCNKQYE